MTLSRAESALRPGDDPRAKARVLRQVRDVVLTGGIPENLPRAVIQDSWRRVRGSGVNPSGGVEIEPLDGAQLRLRRERSGLSEIMPLLRERLLPAAEAAGQVMVVVDREGRVLWREGGPAVRRRADALGFVEGSAWDESTVGTNAIGTSLVVGVPVHVFAAEHYAETHQPWTCAAAPLHDPLTGRLLGAVDLSGPAHTVHASTVALVDAVARLVRLEVRAAHEERHTRLRSIAATLLAGLSGRAVVVGADGCVIGAAGFAAAAHLSLSSDPAEGSLTVAGLGSCTAEALPGGWLLRPVAGTGPAPSRLVLDLRGTPRVQVCGGLADWTQPVSPRHAEILLALAQHPAGRSAAELAGDLFGDPRRTVTVRAELSRLRRTLGSVLEHLPYRIAPGVEVSVQLPEPRSALLPASDAPLVRRLRLI
jgi:hypothetical protein